MYCICGPQHQFNRGAYQIGGIQYQMAFCSAEKIKLIGIIPRQMNEMIQLAKCALRDDEAVYWFSKGH